MIFTETKLAGAFVVELERREDERGWFARMFCQREFGEHGLNPILVQGNVAFNRRRGTLRGMHFQFPPSAEAKYVRCTRGAILDVLVDLRPESTTFLEHVAVELNEENGRGVLIPKRFAHGYQVLRDDTETTYLVDEFYDPAAEGGLHHDDPALGITWPLPIAEISPKDEGWAAFADAETELRRRMQAAPAP